MSGNRPPDVELAIEAANRRGYWSGSPRTNIPCQQVAPKFRDRYPGTEQLCRHHSCMDQVTDRRDVLHVLDGVLTLRQITRNEVVVLSTGSGEVWLDEDNVRRLVAWLEDREG